MSETAAGAGGAAAPRTARTARASIGTYIARGMTWRGEVVSAEHVRVAGVLEGSIESSAEVTVERSGVVRGRISAARVRVAGEVEGDVIAARLVRVESSGRVHGDLEARSVSVQDGAVVGGQIRTMTGEAGSTGAEG